MLPNQQIDGDMGNNMDLEVGRGLGCWIADGLYLVKIKYGKRFIVLRSHAGLFCVLLLIIWMKKTILFWFLSRSYTILVYILAVWNTPFGKRHASRTVSVTSLRSTRYLRRKLTFTAISLVLMADHTPPAWKTYEFSRHRCYLTLNFGDNASQPLTFRPMPASS